MVDEIKATGANLSAGPIGRLGAHAQSAKAASGRQAVITDRVEISELGALLGKYSEMPEIRSDLVAEVRGQIQAGTYETPEKWNQAIQSLLEDLRT
ncbi:MAG: flagellar biosynthesis anti-sigma factor FlgM [Phycisphaerae bacterium]